MTYLERASVARKLKALLVGVDCQGRVATMPAVTETPLPTDTPDFAVAGSPFPFLPA